ncbi:MAG: response regulator [Chitinispirillales bacterium]|jgi:putative nucleotidyltransferase with HDIG domain|nr:response regulator [Chitinispirillales bacterium]
MNNPQTNIVLLVEDEEELRSSVTAFLSGVGFKVISAVDGLEALRVLEQVTPHVIVSDLKMPNMDGIEFLDELRRSKSGIPVIVTTGYPDIDTSIKAIQAGACDYIVKPYHFEALNQKIHLVIKSSNLKREKVVLSELVSLHEIISMLTSTHNLEELLDVTIEQCLRTAGAQSGSIQLYDKENNDLVIVRERGIKVSKHRSSLDNTAEWVISKKVFNSGTPILLGNEADIPEADVELRRDDIGSAISVPLRKTNEVIGVVNLNRDKGQDPFSAVDLNVVGVLASQAGIAINNANLYTSINQKLYELSFIGTYSESLMGLVDTTAIIKCLFDTVQKNFPIDFIGFFRANKRNFEFLHWSRGALAENSLLDIVGRVTAEYAKTANINIPLKKVINKHLDLKSHSHNNAAYPFIFEHLMQISLGDTNFGSIVFGAARELPDSHEKISLLSSLVSQTRIALTNSKLYNDMKENYIRTIKALAIAVDAKDRYTHGHSENVQHYAEELAQEMNLDEKLVGVIRDGALLHDIGKIGIPGHILNKPGPLTHEEFNGIMKDHSALGANIVKDVPFLKDLYKLILHHHEHYDGKGYPLGLSGDEIPIGARVIHLADAFEAMTSTRPYRSSLGAEEAIRRIVKDRGKQFDPQIVDAFMAVANRKGWISEKFGSELRIQSSELRTHNSEK